MADKETARLDAVVKNMSPQQYDAWRRALTDEELKQFTPLEQDLINMGKRHIDDGDDTWYT